MVTSEEDRNVDEMVIVFRLAVVQPVEVVALCRVGSTWTEFGFVESDVVVCGVGLKEKEKVYEFAVDKSLVDDPYCDNVVEKCKVDTKEEDEGIPEVEDVP